MLKTQKSIIEMRVQTRIRIRKDVRKRREGTLHKQELSQLQIKKGFVGRTNLSVCAQSTTYLYLGKTG